MPANRLAPIDPEFAARVRFLGTTDDVTTCECCGRSDLKSTVALELEDGALPVYFGVTCAARALSRPAKEIKSESARADRERAELERKERAAAWDAAQAPWFAFLASRGNGSDVFTRIQSLGGHAAAKALFAAESAS